MGIFGAMAAAPKLSSQTGMKLQTDNRGKPLKKNLDSNNEFMSIQEKPEINMLETVFGNEDLLVKTQ